MPTYEELGFGRGAAVAQSGSRAMFGQVMGLVAFTFGFATLGAYLGRHSQGGLGIFGMLAVFACVFAIQAAVRRGREQLAIGLLFGMGLLLGLGVAPLLYYYAKTEPGVVWQAAGSTAAFTGILGSYGYATRRDFSSWGRTLFWCLIAFLVATLVLIFTSVPGANIIWCVVGLGLFGFITVFDFNRLSRMNNLQAAPLIAASIFLDIFNVFLFMLQLFGGGNSRR